MNSDLIARHAEEILSGQAQLQCYSYDGAGLEQLLHCVLDTFSLCTVQE